MTDAKGNPRRMARGLSKSQDRELELPRLARGMRADAAAGSASRAQDEFQSRLCRPELGLTEVGDRVRLVTFMQYDFGLLRRRDVSARTDRESLRPESVTSVSE